MSREQTVATWISFMGTAFRNTYGLSRTQFSLLAKKYRLIPFLAENYDLLHYYDNGYIVEDLMRHINEQSGTIKNV